MRLSTLIIAVLGPLVAMAGCGQSDRPANSGESALAAEGGFSVTNMDLSVDPGHDFARYATGGWMDRTEIPSDKVQVLAASTLLDSLDAALLDIARTSAAATGTAKTGNVQLVGDFFTSIMDTATIDARGIAPIEDLLAAAASATSPAQVAALAARLEKELGANPFLNTTVSPDTRNMSAYALRVVSEVSELGYGLNRNEYVNPDNEEGRGRYRDSIAAFLQLAGDSADAAGRAADAALAFEVAVAEGTMTPVEAADPNNTYNALSGAELKALVPALDLDAYYAGLGVDLPSRVIAEDPGALTNLQRVLGARSPEALQAVLRAFIVRRSSFLLGGDFYTTAREFARVRAGLPSLPPREKEATDTISFLMAHPYSRLYVADHFRPETRDAVVDMMDRFKTEFAKRIDANSWLSDSTKQTAQQKLARIQLLVGYPERDEDWIDYSSVTIAPDDYFGNVARLRAFDKARILAQLGRPVEVDHFTVPGRITPISMNAAIHQGLLAVYVTAAFAQPPYYVAGGDPAANFGALGAVVGHELTHAFDSKGRNYDANGELHDWWTPEDAAEFTRRANGLVKQYNAYDVAPGVQVNGELTLSENIADLGGLTLGYHALQTYMAENGRLPDVDGLSPEQRYFLGWAQAWMAKTRVEVLKIVVATDPHSPSEVRSFGPAVNMDEFYAAFGITEDDPVWKAPADRVTIW